ncbi:B12-binding domain-containing radical SAM protein [Geomonas oryzae]|uniref:B12-binding domain-containing radical SAM protein n=1 Tax=Geomonas oryzae TaxID=2364273 RepID=UPI00100B28C0|nr:radical SAM protein [Geomonas oryzae]
MRLVFVNVMQELQKFDSTAYITQPPVPLAVLNSATPAGIETALMDEQTERIRYTGDAFAFSVSTQNSAAVYDHADALRAAGKKVLLGGIHVTVCPDEALQHADAIVTGEAEGVWPEVCGDLLAGTLKGRYDGSPTPSERMSPVDYRFFGSRRYLTPASLFATRGCNRRCSFCVSSNHMGPYRMKPLDVLEQEIDQLSRLYPGIFLQFTDDNLLADKNYRGELLPLLRRKGVKFITMVTVDQYCDTSLVEEMAASGCIGVAVGVESVDDDNCASMNKYQNLSQPFRDAVRHANGCGIQTAALIMLGLPHDTPARLEHTLRELQDVPCSLYDIRILRIYPSTSLYREMLATGEVTENWWLQKEPHGDCNHLLPSCLSVHFRHRNFGAMELQRVALRYTSELNRLNRASITEITRIGSRGNGLKLAATVLYARRRAAGQARRLQQQVESAMTAQQALTSCPAR